MKRNTTFSLVAFILVVLGGVGMFVAYKGYKKYKAKQNQEFRFEGTMGKAREGFDKEIFKQAVLSEDTLDKVVESHQLVDVWGVADAAAAKERIKQKFTVKLEAMVVKVTYQDKNKDLAQKILQSIVSSYYEKVKGISAPPSEPGAPPASP
ncbi:MAG: hypothetical protein H7A51_17960 [Akkermansiaceae bacterium]|nr:hypothetical protein [Akkermansiaceae bacterium]